MSKFDLASRLALAVLLGTAACDHDHCNCDTTPAPFTVTAVQPLVFVAYRAVEFRIIGAGFAGPAGVGQQVTVTFRTEDGTPFADGTAAEAQVLGTVTSDTEITGVAPTSNQPGEWLCTIEVSDASGAAVTAAAASLFFGLHVLDIDHQSIASNQATPFQVTGFPFLPPTGTATVRFTSTTPGAFPGGASTVDVPGTIVDMHSVVGTTPVLSITSPVQAFVSVVLDQEPGAPAATSNAALVEFLAPPPVPVVVTSIAPSSLPMATSTPFTITGSGFLGIANPNVEVRFRATSGSPLAGGSAVASTVLGTVVNDTTVTGLSPTGIALSDFQAFVSVGRADGVKGTSATDIALFTVPPESVTLFTPNTARADTATSFAITGANLQTSPSTATVRFRASEGTPFANGTADTIDVTGTIASSTLITGNTPLATTTIDFLAEVTVILAGNQVLPLGVCCLFTAVAPPVPTSTVTTLADSGPGSLREAIANALTGRLIDFDSALTGSIQLESSLTVTSRVTILGPGADRITVSAPAGFADFPLFTIQPAAAGTEIARLTISGSRHNGDGGAFLAHGNLTLQQCVVADNQITGRGAIVCLTDNAIATLLECTLRANSTTNRGVVSVLTGSTLQARRCTFQDNSGDQGGAAVALETGAFLDCSNCTFRGNVAGGTLGGALLVSGSAIATLTHCTFADNSCTSKGGAVFVKGGGTLNATNCIFSRDSAAQGNPEISNGGINNTTFSLVRVGVGSGLTNGLNGNLVGTATAPIDAQLDVLAPNGGPTPTMVLPVTSPARDAANPAASLPTDQRGISRPQGPAPDMGAYEADVIL